LPVINKNKKKYHLLAFPQESGQGSGRASI